MSKKTRAIRTRVAQLIMAFVMIVGMVGFAPPAVAVEPVQVTVGMPFAGKWAYSVQASVPYNDNVNDSHPAAHETYGANWATDLYASPGTEVRAYASSLSGTLSMSVSSITNTSCGAGKRVSVVMKVNGVTIGYVSYEHLDTNIAIGTTITSGTTILGTTKYWGSLSCYVVADSSGTHIHISFTNVSDYACFADLGQPGTSVLTAGTPIGVLGSANTGTRQACGSGLPSGGYQVAFNSGNLWLYGPSLGTINTGLGMMPGTSPAITRLANGGYQVAFVANNGRLWVYGSAGSGDTGLGVASGTSPAIARVGNGYQVAFNSGNLWLYGATTANTGFGMASGTSPAIAPVGAGYQVAFNSGNLWLYGNITTNTGLGMMPSTSPAITAVTSGFQTAFNSGNLWLYGATTANTGFGMASGTSPAISDIGTNHQVAFNGGNLWLYGAVTANTGFGMMPGTRPAVTKVATGTQEAFVSSAGHLWVYGSVETLNTNLGVANGTSPSIAS